MAGRVTKLSVELEGSDKTLGSTLNTGSRNIKKFVEQAERDMARVGGGGNSSSGGKGEAPESFLGGLAINAKRMAAERRKSGEAAFERMIGSGGGIANAAFNSLGLGLKATAVDVIGQGFGKATESVRGFASGEVSAKKFVSELAVGIPIVGEYVKGFQNIFSLLDGSASMERELNQLMQGQAVLSKANADYIEQKQKTQEATSPSKTASELLEIENRRKADSTKLGAESQKISDERMEKISDVSNDSSGGYLKKLKNRIFLQTGPGAAMAIWRMMHEESGASLKDSLDSGSYNESSDKAKRIAEPYEKARLANQKARGEVNTTAAAERKKVIDETLQEMDRSIAASQLGKTVAIGGNPLAVLEARQKLSKIMTRDSIRPIDKEISANSDAIKKNLDLNGLKPEELKERNAKLKAQRIALVEQGEAEVTRLAEDETKRRGDSIYGMEKGIAANRLSVMRATAKTADQQMAAQHQAVTDRTNDAIGSIDDRMQDKSLGADERKKLAEQRKSTIDAGKAEHQRLDEDEGRRRAASLLSIEHQIAASRLSIMRANAHNSAALWAATAQEIKNDTQNKLDDIDQRLKDINLSEAERNKLLQERKGIVAEGEAVAKRAKEDFDKEVKRSQESAAMGLIGISSNLITQRQGVYGGNNLKAMRMQKQLGIMSQSLSMRQQVEGILNDPKASDDQKAAAKQALGAIGSWTSDAMSAKNLNKRPYEPLRFADAEEAGRGFEGRAEFQKEQDENDYAKSNDALEEQKKTNTLLSTIVSMMAKGTPGAQVNPLFPQ